MKDKRVKVTSDGERVCNNGKVVGVKEHTGKSAVYETESGKLEYYICKTRIDCPHNVNKVYEGDMKKFNSKVYYYTQYLETVMYMYIPRGDKYLEACYTLDEGKSEDVEEMANLIYENSKEVELTESDAIFEFEKKVKINCNGSEVKVRPDEIVIPGILRVTEDRGQVETNDSVKVGGCVVGKGTDSKYDYYRYNKVLIQAVTGLDVTKFIVFM